MQTCLARCFIVTIFVTCGTNCAWAIQEPTAPPAPQPNPVQAAEDGKSTGRTIRVYWAVDQVIGEHQDRGKQAANEASLKQLKLPRSVTKELEAVTLPAFQSQSLVPFYESMQKLLSKLSVEQLDAVEEYGQIRIGQSLKKIYVDLKLKSVEQGLPQGKEDERLGAITFLTSELVARVRTQLDDLAEHPVMQDPLTLPESWSDRDSLFWDTHVFQNRLDSAQRLADFGVAKAKVFVRRASRKSQADELKSLKPIQALPSEVRRVKRQLMEREAELRIENIKSAVDVLKRGGDFAQRLEAAFALQVDGENLQEFFKGKKPGEFERAKLNSPNLIAEITNLIQTGRTQGGNVIEKAMRLRIGSHWWLRGRYGAGPMAAGLLKRPEAMNSEREMFGLYMPVARPKPIGTYSTDESGYAPGYDRRHFYNWAVEYRPRKESNNMFVDQTRRLDNVELYNPGGAGAAPQEINSFW